jgi:hypothetical protein
MSIRELSEAEFKATFTPPMRRLGMEESPPVRLNMKEYVTEVITALALPTSTADIQIHYVYVGQDESFTHVNFSWGVQNLFLVIVIDNHNRAIHGHRILDLNKLYGHTP